MSNHIGVGIVNNNTIITDYTFPIAAYVFLLPLILYTPLALFAPLCIGAKIKGIQIFGKTLRKHNLAYKNTLIYW